MGGKRGGRVLNYGKVSRTLPRAKTEGKFLTEREKRRKGGVISKRGRRRVKLGETFQR